MPTKSSLGVRPYKTGFNKGYESQMDKKKREEAERLAKGQLTAEELNKQKEAPTQFRGFIGGKQFRTKMGFQGNAFDSLWGKHVFLSLENDDVELFIVAMQSELADIQERVVGGENGAAFLIGAVGFYSNSQFDAQANKIRAFELAANKNKVYLSDRELDIVNGNIKKISDYANSTTSRAVRGDSFGAIALRSNAYRVAKEMMSVGLDPLVQNEEGEDLFSILEEQYNRMTGRMHDILVEKEQGSHRILVPSEQSKINEKEEHTLQSLRNMLHFLLEFITSLDQRCDEIKADKNLKRRMELQHKKIPEHMLFNISHEHTASENLAEAMKLEKQLRDRIATYERQHLEHVSMADLMHKQHKVVTKKIKAALTPGATTAGPGLQVWSYKDDENAHEDKEVKMDDAKEADGDGCDMEGFAPPDDAKECEREELTAEEIFNQAEAVRAQKEKDRVRREHGLETDGEIKEREERDAKAAEEQRLKEEEEIMAIDFLAAEKKEEVDKVKARLEREVYDEIRGVLHNSEYETTSYR